MKSKIFYTGEYKAIERKTKNFLNSYPAFLTKHTVSSTRAVGDAIHHVLGENFETSLGRHCREWYPKSARRAMADFLFSDEMDLHYLVDVKTHRLKTRLNMPNLTSVERLARLYQDDTNYYVVLIVAYEIVSEIGVRVTNVHFVPIEFLSWDCLRIGALGWGQIQIANANKIIVNENYSRRRWMLQLCEALLAFYPREVEKVKGRMRHFEKIRREWQEKADIWR